MTILFTHRVFTRGLLRESRRGNRFLCLILLEISELGFESWTCVFKDNTLPTRLRWLQCSYISAKQMWTIYWKSYGQLRDSKKKITTIDCFYFIIKIAFLLEQPLSKLQKYRTRSSKNRILVQFGSISFIF